MLINGHRWTGMVWESERVQEQNGNNEDKWEKMENNASI